MINKTTLGLIKVTLGGIKCMEEGFKEKDYDENKYHHDKDDYR